MLGFLFVYCLNIVVLLEETYKLICEKELHRNKIAKWLMDKDCNPWDPNKSWWPGFVINDDLAVDLRNMSFSIEGMNLTKIPIKFNKVDGFFNCSNNKLVTLENAPRIVVGNFICGKNKLKNLLHSPVVVQGKYSCDYNELTSLEGVTRNLSSFSCAHNNLSDLRGGPDSVSQVYDCSFNNIKTLKWHPSSYTSFYIDGTIPTHDLFVLKCTNKGGHIYVRSMTANNTLFQPVDLDGLLKFQLSKLKPLIGK